MKRIVDEQFDCAPYDGDRTYYTICTPPRTGSTVLCHLLMNSGAMGVPTEYFNSIFSIKRMGKRLNLIDQGKVDLAQYTNSVKNLRTTQNGVFGMKMQYWMMKPLLEKKMYSKDFPNCRFIYLTRRDLIAQSVSLDIARQSGKWEKAPPSPNNSSTGAAQVASPRNEMSPEPPVYSRARILDCMNRLATELTSWEMFFSLYDIVPYRLEYENLIEKPDKICQEICEFVGVRSGSAKLNS